MLSMPLGTFIDKKTTTDNEIYNPGAKLSIGDLIQEGELHHPEQDLEWYRA